jgi:hypothetical protein
VNDKKGLNSIGEYPIRLASKISLMGCNEYFKVVGVSIELVVEVDIQVKTSIFEGDAHVELHHLWEYGVALFFLLLRINYYFKS